MQRRAADLLVLFVLGACADDGAPPPPDAAPVDFDRQALLAWAGEAVIMGVHDAFEADARALATAVWALCDQLGGPEDASARAAAQAAWSTAMDTWQKAELMLVGPVAADSHALRDHIYSWPIVSACAVDQDVMLATTDPAYDITTRLTNRRGLAALEYALFAVELASVCPPQARPAGWDALTDEEKRQARCQFAALAAADLVTQATTLQGAWRADGGDFLGDLTSAGQDGSSFASLGAAVDAVFAALFYIDTDTKDKKVAEPAGILPSDACGTQDQVCAAALESQHAHRSKENIAANLAGLDMLWSGTTLAGAVGPGFDDTLRAVDADALADAMAAAITGAQAAVAALPGSLDDALAADPAAVADVHAALKEVTDRLKGEVPATLGLSIPTEAGVDTD
jgi:predicted lipoprotein